MEGLGLGTEDVYVIGGGNSAGQAALHLSRSAARVRLLVRGPSLAADMSQYLRETIAATPNVEVLVETEVTDGGGTGAWSGSSCATTPPARRRRVEAAALFILIGSRPRPSWLPEEIALSAEPRAHGHILTGPDAQASERWPLERPPTTYETSVPGLVAVGDTRYRAVKRVASAVGEGSVVMPDVHAWLAAVAREPQAR